MIWLLLSCARSPASLDLPAPSACTLEAADAMYSLNCKDLVIAMGQSVGGLDGARVELGAVHAWLEHPKPDSQGVVRYEEDEAGLRFGAFARALSPSRGQWGLCVTGVEDFKARCAPTLKALAAGQLPDLRPFHGPPGTPAYTPLRWGDREIELPPGCWLEEDPRGQRAVCGLESLFLFPVAEELGPDLLMASIQPGKLPTACVIGGLPALCTLSVPESAEGSLWTHALLGAVVEVEGHGVWGAACTWLNEGQGLPPICATLMSWPAELAQ